MFDDTVKDTAECPDCAALSKEKANLEEGVIAMAIIGTVVGMVFGILFGLFLAKKCKGGNCQ